MQVNEVGGVSHVGISLGFTKYQTFPVLLLQSGSSRLKPCVVGVIITLSFLTISCLWVLLSKFKSLLSAYSSALLVVYYFIWFYAPNTRIFLFHNKCLPKYCNSVLVWHWYLTFYRCVKMGWVKVLIRKEIRCYLRPMDHNRPNLKGILYEQDGVSYGRM